MASEPGTSHGRSGVSWMSGIVLALPLVGLVVLLVRPEWDMQWQHEPSHFWIVLLAAALNAILAYLTNVAAGQYRDARVVLISLAFLASAGFLGLHALATPGVLLPSANVGFAIATPIGLIIASVFAAASTSTLAGPRARTVLRLRPVLLGGLIVAMATWSVLSILRLPPLDGPPPAREGTGLLDILSVGAVVLYVVAAWRSLLFYRYRGGGLLLSIAAALILLAEAMIAVLVGRNWHASWWEWHLLLLAAFAIIALGARREYRRGGSLAAAFGGLYLEATLSRVDRWYATAVSSVVAADARGQSTDRVLADLRREGATDQEITLLAQTAREVGRLDAAFRPYLPGVLAQGIREREPEITALGGDERVVSVLFADLASFTTFSETRTPTEVIGMLNEYWATVVPIIDSAGGTIEHFAGDGVMALFDAGRDQPDHAIRAARTGLAIVRAGRPIQAAHPGWPTFRVGVNTGPAVVGIVGSEDRRSYTAIGDTTNTAARLSSIGEPGQVVVGRATWDALGDPTAGESLGPVRVKGKSRPVEAWRLTP